MKFFRNRRLTEDRLLTSIGTNFQIDANFSLNMGSSAVQSTFPFVQQTGTLSLSYNINEPEFVESTLQLHDHYYHLFGIVVTVYMVFFYFIKVVFVSPFAADKGQLIAHILLMKTPALMVYPSYA